MNETALVVRDEMSLAETLTLGKTLAASGYFDDASQAAQAVVKILAGRELGLGPIASMTGINVIKGKVALGANVMAATIKRDPRYDYKVIELTAERCELAFYENGHEVGRSTFDIDEARAAGVGKVTPPGKPAPMLTMFPRNLLFARAMSNGYRWYCPDAGGGSPVYTPEELGADVDGEGNVIDVAHTVVRRDANQAIREVYDGQPLDVGHAADIAEAKREADDLDLDEPYPEPVDLDYVPEWIDTGDKGRFTDLAQEACLHLGYAHQKHVENAIKQMVPDRDERAQLTYRSTWILLQEHQRSKLQ